MLLTIEEIEAYAQAILDAVATAKILLMEAESGDLLQISAQKTNKCSINQPRSVEKEGEKEGKTVE